MTPVRVSVIMPVYNAGQYVADSIESILSQTFRDFELIIINDGSTDHSASIIATFKDHRIRFVDNKENIGLARVRNLGISLARGEFIAWLDSDDISLPDRLKRQVQYFDRHPEIDVCGTWVRTIGSRVEFWKYPVEPGIIKSRMIFDDSLATSSIMMRRCSLQKFGQAFDLRFPPAEDYDLWERLSLHNNLANLPAFLTKYRLHDLQSSVISSERQAQAVNMIQRRQLTLLGLEPNSEEEKLHLRVGVKWEVRFSSQEIDRIEDWFARLLHANNQTRIYPGWQFGHILFERFRVILRESPERNFSNHRDKKFMRLPKFWRITYLVQRFYLELYRLIQYR